MDSGEQSPRGPVRGSFDTASLLGIHEPQQLCKTAILPNADFQNTQHHNSAGALPLEKPFITGKSEKVNVNSVQSALMSVLPVTVNSSSKSTSHKLEAVKEPNSNTATSKPSLNKRKRAPKATSKKNEEIKNEKKAKAMGNRNRNKSRNEKKQKQKSAKTVSSDSDSRVGSTGSSSGESSSGGVSSSGSSDSTDEEEREKQQRELARLKKQQKELRRKVQELEQASHESSSQKDSQHTNKKPSSSSSSTSTKTVTSSKPVNNTKKPAPSPAHAPVPLVVSPKTTPAKPKLNTSNEDDSNMSVPLDLCVKKQEPTFEVTSSSFLSSFASSVNTVKKQLNSPPFNQHSAIAATTTTSVVSTTTKLPATAPRRRGRKPKYAIPSNIAPDVAHQLKQNSVRDLSSLLLPQKLLPAPPGSSIRSSENGHSKKSANSIPASKSSPLLVNDTPTPVSTPRKNFTLDSLLGESNGTVEFENKADFLPSSSLVNRNVKARERLRYSNRIKKMEERFQDVERFGKAESSSATESDPDNDHSDSEESVSGSVSTSAGHKRTYDDDSEEFSSKRRRIIPDEREIQIPLEHGWRRETKIRCFSRAGVRGEVTYYTPCGKKLRSYPEVVRYLIKNGITDISRDNFTFSTKVNVGDFLEHTTTATGEEYLLLTEQEVVARINEVRARKGRLGVQNRRSTHQRNVEQEEQQRQWEQKQIQHQLEQQVLTIAEEARRQKEQQRMMKQQERFERLEQLRMEREIRAQQALEEQEIKRQQAAFLREQEMQKRREMLLMVDLERERRRQHMMLVRALETRKKQEERERKREEILYEKRVNREKKMEQRRIELDYLRELKKPVEDMMLKDNTQLPAFNRIPGVKLTGKAFSDILMVFEFLHNFGETLGFDPENLPTLNSLQMAALNMDEKVEEELLSVVHHLLVCAIEDPGVPHCSEALTVLGQNLKDADITNSNVSEVLRLYFTAQDKRGKLCQLVQAKPFLALDADQKCEIVVHLCDDLLGSRVLMRKIDSNIENVNVLRKDKWLVEGDLRRLKTVQQRRLLKEKQLNYEESKQNQSQNTSSTPNDGTTNNGNNVSKDNNGGTSDAGNLESKDDSIAECDKEKLDDLDNESGNESDEGPAHAVISDGEDEDLQLSNEELTKKVDKLTKQLTSYSNKLTKALHTIRAVTFGQDRYHRRYWVLPKCGGVFVESMESSELLKYRERILAAGVEPASENIKATETAEVTVGIKKEEIETTVEEKEKVSTDEDKNDKNDTPNNKTNVFRQEEQLRHSLENIINGSSSNCSTPKNNQNSVIPKTEAEPCEPENKRETISKGANHTDAVSEEKTETIPISVEKKEPPDHAKDGVKAFSEPKNELKELENSLEAHLKSESVQKPVKAEEKKILADSHKTEEKIFPSEVHSKKTEKKPDVNIFMPKFCDNNLGLDNCSALNHALHSSSDRKHTPNPSIPTNQNWLLHSPFFASLLAGNMLFNGPMIPGRESNGTYFNLPKDDTNNPFGPFLGLQPGMLSPEQIFKSLNDKSNNLKPWFSILPRMPCDEDSLPKTQQSKGAVTYTPPSIFMQNSSKSPANQGSHSVSSSATSTPSNRPLSNLQMEILNGMPPGFFLHPFMPHQFGPTSYPNTTNGATPSSGFPASCSSPSPFTPTLSHSSAPMTDFTLNLGRPPSSSTPSSIPTPTATPGPPSYGCATPTYRDSPTPSIKRLMIEKSAQEHDSPKPVPLEFQKGWWRIIDPVHIKDLVNSLHHRGIREKMLQKHVQKHFNYACNSCTQGNDEDTKLEVTDKDKEISELHGGVPIAEDFSSMSREIALRVDLAILEQIENLEEKIDGASMQVKGWKPPPKISTEPPSKFVPACELYRKIECDISDSPKEKSPKKSGKKKSSKQRRLEAKRRALEAEMAESLVDDVEMEEKQDELPPESQKDLLDSQKDLNSSEMDLIDSQKVSGVSQKNLDDSQKDLSDSQQDLGDSQTDLTDSQKDVSDSQKDLSDSQKELSDSQKGVGDSKKDLANSQKDMDEKDKSIVDDDVEKDVSDVLPPPPGKMNPVEEAKSRLLLVEAAIERRYLKPPLGFSSNDLSRTLSAAGGVPPTVTLDGEEETLPFGLVKWRNAVQSCRTSSQLAMCLNYLENFTAWDKSIMRASCQFCHSGENEEMLLLCDGCDKGYHTYCFKPKMEKIPEGDWYCYECLNKATGDKVCVICGKKGKLIDCTSCPKCFHLTCLEPPLGKMPKARWFCSGCSNMRPKKSCKKSSSATKEKEKEKEQKETTSGKKSEGPSQSSKSKSSEKKEKKDKNRNQTTEDLSPCSVVVDEMEKHDDSWPFLSPVNTKQFPTYRKVIKKPMDLATVRSKLEGNQYKSREDFATDVRLIFDNCETFNEDDSPVGQAGHTMRAFFDSRWGELCST